MNRDHLRAKLPAALRTIVLSINQAVQDWNFIFQENDWFVWQMKGSCGEYGWHELEDVSILPGEKKAEVGEEGRQLSNSWLEEENANHLNSRSNATHLNSWSNKKVVSQNGSGFFLNGQEPKKGGTSLSPHSTASNWQWCYCCLTTWPPPPPRGTNWQRC